MGFRMREKKGHFNGLNFREGNGIRFAFIFIVMALELNHFILKFKWMNYFPFFKYNTEINFQLRQRKRSDTSDGMWKIRFVWHMLHWNDTIVWCSHLIWSILNGGSRLRKKKVFSRNCVTEAKSSNDEFLSRKLHFCFSESFELQKSCHTKGASNACICPQAWATFYRMQNRKT